tara:strand:- start:105 stop:515 length:411 start_codon:yes stop_codon:yes gene_type:complete
MRMEKKLTEALKRFNLLVAVNKKDFSEVKADISGPVEETPQKKLFIESINILEEIEEKSGELFEAGIDLSVYETLFFQVIENLLYTIYNENQVNLIHSYIYGVSMSEEAKQPVDKTGKIILPETPEELWNGILLLR